MNTCDQIRATLLTDYIDGELDSVTKKDIERHLITCPECTQLVAMVKKDMSVISDQAIREKVPAHLWQAILGKIEAEERPRNTIAGFVRGIAERFMLPKMVPALAGMILLVLGTSLFLYTQHTRQGYGNESFSYVSGLFTGEGVSATMESDGLGTPIEEYFL